MNELKKNNRHQRSVETLGLSSHGDELIIAEIDKLIHVHDPKQPYSRNLLLRIKSLIDERLNREDGKQI